MRANTPARSEQLNSLLGTAKHELAGMLAVCQRQHLIFSLIENAAGRPEPDISQAFLLSQIGLEITNEARLNIEATIEILEGGAHHG